eukprot:3146991-Amphidinium_carterae.1
MGGETESDRPNCRTQKRFSTTAVTCWDDMRSSPTCLNLSLRPAINAHGPPLHLVSTRVHAQSHS